MWRKATSLAVLVPFSIWASGCAAHKAVERPVSDYVTRTPSSGKTVRVLAVLTKAGEKIEFGEDQLAFVTGDGVVSFEKDARLLTVRKADATLSKRDDELVSIKVKDETYESIRILSETQQEVTFVVAAQASGNEIPFADINQLWVQERRRSKGAEIGLVVAIGFGVLIAIFAASFVSPEYY